MDTGRSIGTVLSDILGDVQHIVRAEVRLAKAEFREEVSKAKRGVALVAAGGVVLIAALGLLLLAAVYALATVWAPWVAALAVAGAVAVTGMLVLAAGRKQLQAVSLKPEKTVSTVKENLQWAKSRTK